MYALAVALKDHRKIIVITNGDLDLKHQLGELYRSLGICACDTEI